MPHRIAAVVLAAGTSSRMGENKLLAEIDGRPMVARVLETLRAVDLAEILVVLGHEAERVRGAIGDAPWVLNASYREGMSTSLRRGAAAIAGADGVLFALGDMPFVRPADIEHLIAAFDPPRHTICVPTHEDRRGNPVLFAVEHLPEIHTLRGDVGAKEILARHRETVAEVPISHPGVHQDIDTQEALARR
jgi:molybdenum cofactor cytidylyltransferase